MVKILRCRHPEDDDTEEVLTPLMMEVGIEFENSKHRSTLTIQPFYCSLEKSSLIRVQGPTNACLLQPSTDYNF